MTGNNILKLGIAYIMYFIIQVLILKDLVLFGDAFCFLYVYAILLLPLEIKPIPLMLLGFFMGLAVDMFYDTPGMHVASTVLLAFLRNPWIKVNTPRGGYDENVPPTLLNMGLAWSTGYTFPLILIHHVCFFYLDFLGTSFSPSIVIRMLSSVLFTFVLAAIVQLLFYNKKKGI
ncbi:rod shape-determining protein MreD [Lunatibacter salilacus]|uniref:rod shape-determining protein MreD n=1 Tax=Lunatibacter salilacus TaxID=2483804 RepID=UPI00131CACD7|nr:rod shape-determining protein MreD [Lunatibacter salilacus]